MNWLAHLFLSEPTAEFRLGTVLPDLVSMQVLKGMPPAFQGGIEQHRRIDALTDSHPIFRRSVQRLEPPFRRFGGVLVDIFYDHFLSRDWQLFSDTPLREFAAEFYASFENHRTDIPVDAYARLQQMQAGDWLCSYGDLSCVTVTLQRVGSRLRRPFDLGASVSVLERDYDLFHRDFGAFFPELCAYVAPKPVTVGNA